MYMLHINFLMQFSITTKLYLFRKMRYVQGLSVAKDGALVSQQQYQYCWIQVESADYNLRADRRKVS